MTDQEFEALVARLDQQARRHPAAYRMKVILLAYAGYAYVGLLLLVAGGLFFATIASLPYLKAAAIKLALIFGGFFWMVAGAMWVRLDPPKGRPINSYGAPELFELIDKLRRSLRAPRFHEVLITDDFNAAVAQTPRLGLLGWYRNSLIIGLPLMKALTREQLAAVLAHEFGHLAGGHGRLANWVYRLRFGWVRLAQALQERRSFGSFAFRPFFKWYAPYFSAVSFPLARANEYEADAASARLTSPSAAAAALTGVNVIGTFLQARYWPNLLRKADQVAQPSFAPFAEMGAAIGPDIDADAMRSWLDAAMARKTSTADTHPALADRLQALGEKPLLALPEGGEAADTLIGSKALQSITEEFDRRWREVIQPAWERRHQEVKDLITELSALEARVAQGEALNVLERVRRAQLTEQVGSGSEAAVAQLRAAYADVPDNALVCYALGARLLHGDDDAGIAFIEQAMQHDEEALLPGAELLRDYFARRGRDELARQWHERWLQRAQIVQEAQAERSDVYQNDTFEPHGLDDAEIAALQARLLAISDLGQAHLVRKRLAHHPERPLFVLAFTVKRWRLHRVGRSGAVQETIVKTVELAHPALVVWMENERYGFLKWRLKRAARIL